MKNQNVPAMFSRVTIWISASLTYINLARSVAKNGQFITGIWASIFFFFLNEVYRFAPQCFQSVTDP